MKTVDSIVHSWVKHAYPNNDIDTDRTRHHSQISGSV